MTPRAGALLCAIGAFATTGCAARAGPDSGSSRDQSVLTADEIRSVSAPTLYDIIRMRRPRWLTRARPTAFRTDRQVDLVVYLDNVRFGGPEALRQIRPTSVGSVQYLGPSQAEARFGQGHMNGAIVVVSAPRP